MFKKKIIIAVLCVIAALMVGQTIFAAAANTLGGIYKTGPLLAYDSVYGGNLIAVPVTGITFNKTTMLLNVNASSSLRATIKPANATNKKVVWATSNSKIAVVSSLGIISGVGKGTAVISAVTEDGNKVATCQVNVIVPVSVNNKRPVNICLDKSNVTLKVKSTYVLTAIITPANTKNKTVSWLTSNSKVATVDSKGKVTGISKGNATIFATAKDNGKIAICQVQVIVPVLNADALSMKIGESRQLTLLVKLSSTQAKTVTWLSSNTKIATVDSKGIVKGKAAGTAVITVKTKDGSVSGTCSVTVVKPVLVTGVTLDKTKTTLKIKAVVQLKATVSPANADNKKVTWSSSNVSVASVDSVGKVTAKKTGTATITVKTSAGYKTAKCIVTVVK